MSRIPRPADERRINEAVTQWPALTPGQLEQLAGLLRPHACRELSDPSASVRTIGNPHQGGTTSEP